MANANAISFIIAVNIIFAFIQQVKMTTLSVEGFVPPTMTYVLILTINSDMFLKY